MQLTRMESMYMRVLCPLTLFILANCRQAIQKVMDAKLKIQVKILSGLSFKMQVLKFANPDSKMQVLKFKSPGF